MKKFEIARYLGDSRCLVKGELKDLYPGDNVVITRDDRDWDAIVETRTTGGAVVRAVLER